MVKYLLVFRHVCKKKFFDSIFTDKIDYGLSQYNVEVHEKRNNLKEMIGRVKLEEIEI